MPLRLCSYGPARKLPLRSSWAAVALRTRQQELRRKRARWWHWRHWGRRSPTWVPFYLRALPETLGHPPPAVEDACTPQSGRDTSPFASRSEAPLLALSGGRAVARHLATPPSPDLTSSPPTSSLRIFSEGPSSSACLPSGPHRILWHSAASQASSVPLATLPSWAVQGSEVFLWPLARVAMDTASVSPSESSWCAARHPQRRMPPSAALRRCSWASAASRGFRSRRSRTPGC
mmetsp:Transcript_2983/g.12067  ORF Transcript_2983/g.12067 Transcript_2983/m.12067 type:complete len:233 (-) Transcript_2983:990-1688(-)